MKARTWPGVGLCCMLVQFVSVACSFTGLHRLLAKRWNCRSMTDHDSSEARLLTCHAEPALGETPTLRVLHYARSRAKTVLVSI